MIASLVICTILYVLMSGVLTGMKKYTTYLGDSAAVATAFAGKPWAQALVSAGALAGLTSVLLVFQLGQPRIFMAMARDGLLPQYFARIHPRFRTPHITTIWTGICRRRRRDADRYRFVRRPHEYWDPLRLRFGLLPASSCCAKRIRTGRGRFACRSFRCFRSSACFFAAL